MLTERDVLVRLQQTYPRIREEGRGWVLETAPNVLVPVPDPSNVLAYIAHQGRYSKAQLRDIQLALQKRLPVQPDPSTIFYLEQCIEAAS
jgi:hypothetical protein